MLSIDLLLQGIQMDKQETFTLENQVIYIQEYFRLGGIYTGQGKDNRGWNSTHYHVLQDMHYDFCILVSDTFWELGLEADELHWLLCWYGLGYDKIARRHDYLRWGTATVPIADRSHTQFPFRRSERIRRFCQKYPFEMERRDIECLTDEMAEAIAKDIKSKTKDIKDSIDWGCGYRQTESIRLIQPNGVCRWDTMAGIEDTNDYHTSPYVLTTYDWRRRVQLENKLEFSFAKLNLPIYDARTDYDLLTKHSSPTKTLKEIRKKYYGNKYNHYSGDNSNKRKRTKRPTS
ncbi:hypothetical protein N9R99_02310 [Gammaproteobacteria bacterium]|nr:hypothetical protein [Gammaproteobacteria bacterium]